MRPVAALLFSLLLAAPAWGQNQVVPPPDLDDAPVRAPSTERLLREDLAISPDGRLFVSPALCDRLAEAAEVPGADLRPGVDVDGRPVAPADIPRFTLQDRGERRGERDGDRNDRGERRGERDGDRNAERGERRAERGEFRSFEIGPDLRRRFGVGEQSLLLHRRGIGGHFTLHRDGRAFFRGQAVSRNERDMIMAACGAWRRR